MPVSIKSKESSLNLITQTNKELELSTETQALMLMARTNLDTNAATTLHHCLLMPSFDWQRFRFIADINGVSPLLLNPLQQIKSHNFPSSTVQTIDSTIQTLKNESNIWYFNNLALTHYLIELLNGLSQAGILAIPYKGAILTYTCYPDLSLRRFSDLDIWVAPHQVAPAIAWLQSQGFEITNSLHWECALTNPQTSINVDLHHAITSNQFPFNLPFDQVAARLQTSTIEGQPIQHLSPEDTLLVQCVGWCKDAWGRSAKLSQLCDVAEVLRSQQRLDQDLDWDYVISQAKDLDAENIVLLPLALAHSWLGAPLPREILSQSQKSSTFIKVQHYAGKEFWNYAQPQTDAQQILSNRDHSLYFGLRPTLIAKFKYLIRVIVTPTEKEKRIMKLNDKLSWLYIPLRLVLLLSKYSQGLIARYNS